MKKILLRLMFLAMLVALLPVQVAQACSAFIVGKDLTADGSTLFVGQRTIPTPLTVVGTIKTM